jgi:hypothetical protein
MGAERPAPGRSEIPDLAPPSASPDRLVPSRSGEGRARVVDPYEGEGQSGTLALELVDTSFGPGFDTTHELALDDDVIERTAASTRSLPVRPLEPERPWPSGVSPDSANIDLDPSEIALTAEYPPPPASYFATFPYAVGVLLRKKALGAKVCELNERLLDAERRRDGLLVAMVGERRAVLESAAEGRKLLEFVTRIETLAQEKRAALTGLSDEIGRRSADIEGEARSIAKQRVASGRQIEIAKAVFAEREEAHDRVEARKKRLYIEIRSILDAVENAGGGATPAQNAELSAREADVAAQRPELERTLRELSEARAVLESREATDQELARRARDVERRRAAFASEAQDRLGVRNQGVMEAETHRKEAIVEAARGILAAKGRLVDVPPTTLDAIAAADAEVAACARELERHVRAIDAYDREGVKNGVIAAITVIAVIVLAVVWLFS